MNRTHRSAFLLLLAVVVLAALPAVAEEAAGVVNINTADGEVLTLLPRVGAVVAQRIEDYREQNGRFKALEELMLVKGIGERTFELIRPHIALEGETTLTEKVRVSRSSDSQEG